MTNPTSCLKESHRTWGYMYMCCQEHKDTLSLRQNWAQLCKGIHASWHSPVSSGCSWPSPCCRDAPTHGYTCSGWKDCTQARGASQGLGEERGTEEMQASYDFSWFWGAVVLNESNSYIILFTVSSLFSDFSPTGKCSPECYSRRVRHIQSSWGVSYPELSVWNKLEQLQHFLVQATSQWRDDFPYKGWPLLYKFWEITWIIQPHHFNLTTGRFCKVLLCSLGTHSVWSNRKSWTKTPKLNKRKPLCCKTLAEIHPCRSQTINGSPVVASSVVWIRRFNFKYKLLLCCMEAGVQSNFLMVHSPLEFLTLNQPYRTYVKLSKFENLPHNTLNWKFYFSKIWV